MKCIHCDSEVDLPDEPFCKACYEEYYLKPCVFCGQKTMRPTKICYRCQSDMQYGNVKGADQL